MNDDAPQQNNERTEIPRSDADEIALTAAQESPPKAACPSHLRPRRVRLPLLLFIATCLSTFLAGAGFPCPWVKFDFSDGFIYALSVMTILICHEAGHYLQARRYGVYASLPYFLPMPFSPLGTFGAVIGMDARVGDRKALFDIGITGPLAGLVPTMVCCVIGLRLSTMTVGIPDPDEHVLGTSILFAKLAEWLLEPVPGTNFVDLHPMAAAGWVGLLITALNLLPTGQLDGGHILYGLLRTKAHYVATLLLLAAVVAVVQLGLWWWWLMLFLLILMGPKHPPTANDYVRIGLFRHVLGWLTLAFVPFGFTPIPFFR